MRSETKSIGVAATIAPLAVIPGVLFNGVCFYLYGLVVNDASETISSNLDAVVVTSLFGVPIAYLLMLVIGLPAAIAANKSGRVKLSWALAAGAIVGAATAITLKGGEVELPSFFFMVANGLFVAGAFYFLFRKISAYYAGVAPRSVG